MAYWVFFSILYQTSIFFFVRVFLFSTPPVARAERTMEARGTPGSRAVAIANRHAATAVRVGSGGTPMTQASCMTLAYAKDRVEASRTAGEHIESHTTVCT